MTQTLIHGDFVYRVYDDKTAAIAECWKVPTGTLYIPETVQGYTVTKILTNAFKEKSLLEKVVIPTTVQLIGEKAFFKCEALRFVDIANPTVVIQGFAFAECVNLTYLAANQVMLKGRGQFFDCRRLKCLNATFMLDIPDDAFGNCEQLPSLTFQHVTVLRTQSAFYGCKNLKQMLFLGDGQFSDNLVALMQNVEIYCPSYSILTSLAYEGYKISII